MPVLDELPPLVVGPEPVLVEVLLDAPLALLVVEVVLEVVAVDVVAAELPLALPVVGAAARGY